MLINFGNKVFSLSVPCMIILNRNTKTFSVFSSPVLPLHDKENRNCLDYNMADIWFWEDV